MIRNGHVALILFVSTLGAIGAMGLSAAAAVGPKTVGPRSILNGSAEAAFLRKFEKAVPFKDAAVSLVAALRYDAFGEGYQGVVIGDDGWLFSTEEFEPSLARREDYLRGSAEDALVAARDGLATDGITLVVAVIPSKARVYDDELAGNSIPAAIQNRYGNVLDMLKRLSIPAVDVAEAFQSARRGRDTDGTELFLRTDSHWTPAGAATAARAVADKIRELGVDLPESAIESIDAQPTVRDGDLMSYMPRRGTTRRPLPPPEAIAGYETYSDSGTSLFDSQEIPIALLGTSYSADPLWHFDGFLKRELRTDVLNLSESGKGPFRPMSDALTGGVLRTNGIRLVVWEIPERYVPTDEFERPR
ncbi:MAG: hypothetical protein CVV47_02880 [Spirochaetae bacterium HGW-Spirochaetae-3]|jgi:alginate O-acetyltransferase complex protein AlgJ|nr:MAG: hypothetical protein CVV47_02880 [Spirochaetae bacterium HGW-Spirochaetae-3]